MENFEIYSTYNLKGNFLSELTKIYKQTQKTEELLKRLKKSFSDLSNVRKIDKFAQAVGNAANKTGDLSKSVGKLSNNYRNLARNITDATAGLRSFSASATKSNSWSSNFSSGGGINSGSGGGGRGNTRNGYTPGIPDDPIGRGLMMIGGSRALSRRANIDKYIHEGEYIPGIRNSLSSENSRSSRTYNGVIGGGSKPPFFGNGLKGMGLAGMKLPAGAAPYIGAYAAFKFGKASYEEESEYQRILLQMKASGLNDAQVASAQKYTSNWNFGGISKTQALAAFNDSWMATRNFSEAGVLAPTLSKAMLAAHVSFKDMTDEQEKNLVRFAELRSGGNQEKMQSALNLGYKLQNLSAGSLKSTELRTFMRQAGSAGAGMSDLGFISQEPIIQELGGAVTGTAIQAIHKQLSSINGSMTGKASIEDLERLGVYDKVEHGKNGKIISKHTSDGWYNSFNLDPYMFYQKLMAAYAKDGTTKYEDVERRYSVDFPNGRAARYLSAMHKADTKIGNLRGQATQVEGIDQTLSASQKTQIAHQAMLSQSFSDLKKTLGEFASPAVILGMDMVNKFFTSLSLIIKDFSKAGGSIGNFIGKSINNLSLSGLEKNKDQLLSAIDYLRKPSKDNSGNYLMDPSMFKNMGMPQITIPINLDGKQIANVVTKQQNKAMSSINQGGTTTFNNLQSPVHLGGNFAGGVY